MKMEMNGEYDIIHVSSHYIDNEKLVNIDIEDFMNEFNGTIGKSKFRRNKLIISFDGIGDILLNINLFKEVFRKENYIKDKYNYVKIDYVIFTSIPNKNILDIEDYVLKYNINLKINYLIHSPIECVRHEYYPNNKVSVCEGLDYLNHFYKRTSNVVINYDFIDGVNDSNRDLNRICELLDDYTIPIKFTVKKEEWINSIHKTIPSLKIIV